MNNKRKYFQFRKQNIIHQRYYVQSHLSKNVTLSSIQVPKIIEKFIDTQPEQFLQTKFQSFYEIYWEMPNQLLQNVRVPCEEEEVYTNVYNNSESKHLISTADDFCHNSCDNIFAFDNIVDEQYNGWVE